MIVPARGQRGAVGGARECTWPPNSHGGGGVISSICMAVHAATSAESQLGGRVPQLLAREDGALLVRGGGGRAVPSLPWIFALACTRCRFNRVRAWRPRRIVSVPLFIRMGYRFRRVTAWRSLNSHCGWRLSATCVATHAATLHCGVKLKFVQNTRGQEISYL